MYEQRIRDAYPDQTKKVCNIQETWDVYCGENPTASLSEFGLTSVTFDALRGLSENETTLVLRTLCFALKENRRQRAADGRPVVGYVPSGVTGEGAATHWSRDFA